MSKKDKLRKLRPIDIGPTLTTVPQGEGNKLLGEAVRDFQNKNREEVIYWVRMIVEREALMIRIINQSEKRLALIRGQLAAIEVGEFSILPNRQLFFKDERLNFSWDATAAW